MDLQHVAKITSLVVQDRKDEEKYQRALGVLEGAYEMHNCDNVDDGRSMFVCKVAHSIDIFLALCERGNPGPVGRALGVFCSRNHEELETDLGSDFADRLHRCICAHCGPDDCSKLEMLRTLLTAHKREVEKSGPALCSCCHICKAVRRTLRYLSMAEEDALDKEMCDSANDSESDCDYC